MSVLDPTRSRLSPHFLLSDMMGCSSVYAQGHANVFDKVRGHDIRLVNGQALCEHALEPLLALTGCLSISYGFISPELSHQIVTYQDPRKPSHHRWDLGAAVDVCLHRPVLQSIAEDNASPLVGDWNSPMGFALEHMRDLPLSRLISYSESPYLCVAISAEEVKQGTPRGAWYENRYTGKAKVKPQYLKYPSAESRVRALAKLQEQGLEHGWVGGGFPSYHGGGRKQLHHFRTSRYTMLTDWLFDEEFVGEGIRNQPSLTNPAVWQAFELAGRAYDFLIDQSGYPRLSIVSAYTSHLSPGWMAGRDWREGDVSFEIVPPQYTDPEAFIQTILGSDMKGKMHLIFGNLRLVAEGDRVIVTIKRGIQW